MHRCCAGVFALNGAIIFRADNRKILFHYARENVGELGAPGILVAAALIRPGDINFGAEGLNAVRWSSFTRD